MEDYYIGNTNIPEGVLSANLPAALVPLACTGVDAHTNGSVLDLGLGIGRMLHRFVAQAAAALRAADRGAATTRGSGAVAATRAGEGRAPRAAPDRHAHDG